MDEGRGVRRFFSRFSSRGLGFRIKCPDVMSNYRTFCIIICLLAACRSHFLSWTHEVNVNEVSQAKYAIGQDGGCGRNDLELQNIDHLSSVFRSELQRSKNTFVTLQMEMESLMTMTQSCWCLLQSPHQLGYQDCEKVWSREANISKIARSPISVIYDWETLMFITIINVDCLKCLKTQFALHGRCETSNGYT